MNKKLERNKGSLIRGALMLLSLAVASVFLLASTVNADPHTGQSQNVVIIGGSTLDMATPCGYGSSNANSMAWTYGGCLQLSGPVGELGDFTFAPMLPATVNATTLAPYDTAVLNVASYAMRCNTNILSASQQADLVAFVAAGKKLIIFDSECYPGPVDYSWLPFPFQTANPGALGAAGTATIVEDNYLSTLVGDPTCSSGDIHCINAISLGSSTDAIGDMNVLTTFDPNWCVDISGTNAINVTGPVHTYAKYPAGTDAGLIIYNGLDMDYLSVPTTYPGVANLRKVWVQELQQPFNPSNLPCGVTVVGISISPLTAVNLVGEDHTVTAKLTDLLNNPGVGIDVTITVLSGPNAGISATGATDADGEFSLTYTGAGGVGIDQIQACFSDQAGAPICSQAASKEWIVPAATCDVNGDTAVNIVDIMAIAAGRGTSDPDLDIDGDGTVTTNDMRKCVLECDNPRCAP